MKRMPAAIIAGAAFALASCNSASGPTPSNQSLIPAEGSSSGGALQPTFSSVVTAATPPPPLTGGTLLVMKDGKHAVAADPDRDLVYVVDLVGASVLHTISLKAGDEPGRVVEDGAGHVHVALRGGGALLTIDPLAGTVLAQRAVCPAPRGVAWDPSTNLVWVACATGEIVSLAASGGTLVNELTVERDLRDIVVTNGSLSVSSFRAAQVLRIGSDGSVARRDQLPSPNDAFLPRVAWRAIPGPSGAIIAVHQASTTQSLSTVVQGGYGGGCSGGLGSVDLGNGPIGGGGSSSGPIPLPAIDVDDAGAQDGGAAALPGIEAGSLPGMDSGTTPSGSQPTPPHGCYTPGQTLSGGALSLTVIGGVTSPSSSPSPLSCPGPEAGAVIGVLTVVASDGSITVNTQFLGVLPVDVAVSNDGSIIAAVAPGNAFTLSLSTIFEFTGCDASQGAVTAPTLSTQATAVAFDPSNNLVVQTREPASLMVFTSAGTVSATITLSNVSRADTGFDIVHTQAGGMIACGSCHPEGGDDGHVWLLNGDERRTPSLRGTIAGTAPYHWPGDEANLTVLVNDVYTQRMSGAQLNTEQMTAITGWVQSIPAPSVPSWIDLGAAARGKVLYDSPSVGCATCHSGPKFTNNQTVDVGTGGAFQVPPLVGVGWRAPFMHDGCAATLADRFGSCATPAHGSTSSLTPENISELIAYLETL
jgi:hypothetical protein